MSDTLIKHPRLLLSEVRGGDFAHAGDKDSIDHVLTFISEIKGAEWLHNKTVLDAGCGFGGTADYIQKKTNSKVYGVDIDVEAIRHCKKRYENCSFVEGDLNNIDFLFSKELFDCIFLFNVIYSVEDKLGILRKARKVLKGNGVLSIFDYFSIDGVKDKEMTDLSSRSIQPIIIDEFLDHLPELNFKCLQNIDLTKQFKIWYQESLSHLKFNKAKYELRYDHETINRVTLTFEYLLNEIESKRIGGGLLIFA